MDWTGELDEGDALLAPVQYEDVPEEPDDPDPTAPPVLPTGVAEDGQDPDDGGVSDADRVVRVWVEDGRLTKVRVSPLWAERLDRSRRSLDEVISAALVLAHVGAAPRHEREHPQVELTPQFARSLPAMNEDNLGRILRTHEERLEGFRQRGAARGSSPTGPSVVGRTKGIEVALDPRGCATSVRFDEKWLGSAQAGMISTGVLAAANDAYARWEQQDQNSDSEQDALVEGEYLRQVMYTMLMPQENR